MTNWIILCVIVLTITGFLSGTEIAFFSANRFKIELKNSKGDWSGKILSYFYKNVPEFISILLISHNLMLVIYSMIMAFMIDHLAIQYGYDLKNLGIKYTLLQTAVSTFIVLLFAEYIPKILFKKHADRAIIFATPIIYLISKILKPAVLLLNFLNHNILFPLFKLKETEKEKAFTKTDLQFYIEENFQSNEKEPEINPEIFSNALYFNELKIREIMIPRTEIIAVPFNISIQELENQFIKTELSRMIVYENSLDNIVGYIHVLDLLKRPTSLNDILKKIIKVPESMLAHQLLSEFNSKKKSIAVVLDEFGGTSGLVTVEDLIESVIGEIDDEFDEFNEEGLTEEKISVNHFIFSARHEIDYLNKKYELHLPEGEYTTLAGFITSITGLIPQKDEIIEFENLKIKIIEATPIRIELVEIFINQ